MAKMFNLKGPTFENMIMSFVKVVSEYNYERLVEDLTKKYNVELLNEKKKIFKHYPFALYATVVTFH
ncbi:hypothetical protein BWQ96_10280 [Gracilariopsis chorda]|uniref:Uncharacterized protein n=1 Tax=Gracilariopsis chorda TaxID=448386 RepID=A0A2V3ID53_9FLOR|nr:hypothetical protein BWQ96_10280 [Gracilariopsis chorda]|eukprot:PXF40012.1 hypothetical protein BWQ96_10280 [Gracilariopsis chorda]